MYTVGGQYKLVAWQCLSIATTEVVVMVVNEAMHHGLIPGYSGSKGECSGVRSPCPKRVSCEKVCGMGNVIYLTLF